jgi:protoporphyrinogen/coproporphyrinogen III oxidase
VCVIATTHNVSEVIYPELREWVPGYTSKLEYVRQLSVSLAYSVPTRSQAYVVQVPTIENADLMLIFLQHHKAPDRTPAGHSLITVYTDTLAWPRFEKMSDADVEAWACREIERLFPELAGHFLFSTIAHWPITGYLATPGFWRRTRPLLQARTPHSRVQIAGDIFGAGSMESAVTWGTHAAGQLIRSSGRPL